MKDDESKHFTENKFKLGDKVRLKIGPRNTIYRVSNCWSGTTGTVLDIVCKDIVILKNINS